MAGPWSNQLHNATPSNLGDRHHQDTDITERTCMIASYRNYGSFAPHAILGISLGRHAMYQLKLLKRQSTSSR